MPRLVAIAAVLSLAACGAEDERVGVEVVLPGAAPGAADKADSPREAPTVTSDSPCQQPGAYSCTDSGSVLFCREGYSGSAWVDRGPCPAGQACAAGYGCAALPVCGDEGLLACAGDEVFACDDRGAWLWRETCPAGLRCIHGLGCPNVDGVGEPCRPELGPRCVDGQRQRCELWGVDLIWGFPEDCPADAACRDGQGCVRPDDCQDRNHPQCVDERTAQYCVERPDGVLGWGDPVTCRYGCRDGTGCIVRCRVRGRLGECVN